MCQQADSMPLLLSPAQAHPDNVGVQLLSMQIIARIPQTEEWQALLLDLTADGAYTCIVNAMRQHSLVLAIQQVGGWPPLCSQSSPQQPRPGNPRIIS